MDEPPKMKPLAKVIEHPAWRAARAEHRRDVLADVLIGLLTALAEAIRAGAVKPSPALLEAVRSARTTLENAGYEVTDG